MAGVVHNVDHWRAAVAVVLLATAACGGDDRQRPDPGDGATATSATTTTQPSAVDDPDAAFDAVDRVVRDSTDLVADMYEDPQAALNDPGNDDLERYRTMIAEGLDIADRTEQTLRGLVDSGQHMQPAASGVFYQATAYGFSAVDADTVSFRACVLLDQETVDAEDDVVAREATAVLGEGEARREGGLWRFAGVVPDRSSPVTLEPGQANANYCDIVASANQGDAP